MDAAADATVPVTELDEVLNPEEEFEKAERLGLSLPRSVFRTLSQIVTKAGCFVESTGWEEVGLLTPLTFARRLLMHLFVGPQAAREDGSPRTLLGPSTLSQRYSVYFWEALRRFYSSSSGVPGEPRAGHFLPAGSRVGELPTKAEVKDLCRKVLNYVRALGGNSQVGNGAQQFPNAIEVS